MQPPSERPQIAPLHVVALDVYRRPGGLGEDPTSRPFFAPPFGAG
jgi:hypothetical protein